MQCHMPTQHQSSPWPHRPPTLWSSSSPRHGMGHGCGQTSRHKVALAQVCRQYVMVVPSGSSTAPLIDTYITLHLKCLMGEFERHIKHLLQGSFYKASPDASTYRGELLGLTIPHLLVLAFHHHYSILGHMGFMYCDNECALRKGSIYCCRISSSNKHGTCSDSFAL